MKALLLNSGIGSRMGKMTEDAPKCMCPIGDDYTILKWQLQLLNRPEISSVIITTGYLAEKLEVYARSCQPAMDMTFVFNPKYNKTNYIYSMCLAEEYLRDDDILLLHGDLVLDPAVIDDLIHADRSVIAVDRTLPLPEKDFKAKITDGRVSAVGIHYFGDDCEACQAAYKWQSRDFQLWMGNIQAFCDSGNVNVYAEEAFNAISDRIPLFPLEMTGRLCSEIDNHDDYIAVTERFSGISKGK